MPIDVRGFDFGRGVTAEAQGFTGLLRSGQQVQQQQMILEQQRQQQQKQQQIGALLGQAIQPPSQQQTQLAEQGAEFGEVVPTGQPTREELIQDARSVDPIMAEKMLQSIGLDTESKRADASRAASTIMTAPPAQRQALIKQRIQDVTARGGNARDSIELLDMSPEEQDQALIGVQLADLSTKERFAVQARQRATGPKIGTFNPRDYTTESFAEFRQTGDPSKLVRFKETAAVKREEDIKAAVELEKRSVEKRQKIELQKIKIDETKFKDEEGRAQAIAAKDVRRKEADNAVDVINNLLKEDRFSAGFGRIAAATPEGLLPKETVDIKAEVAQVVNLIGLESRQKLKGQGTVSDSEALALARSATTLANPLLSDDAARKELKRVRGIFEDASARNQLKKETKESALTDDQPEEKTVIRFDEQGNIIQ